MSVSHRHPAPAQRVHPTRLVDLSVDHITRTGRTRGANSPASSEDNPGSMTRLLPMTLLVLGTLVLAPAAAADRAQEAALAQRYAPVVRLVTHTDCSPGKPYLPIDVNLLFGEPTVALRGPWTPTDLVKIGPTAKDLSTGLFDYHLDFPGSALDPGCDYVRWDRRLTTGTEPDRLRARRDRPRATREARAPVLALLRLQRLEQPARGRLGDDPARLRRATPAQALLQAAGRGRLQLSTRAPSGPTGTTTSSSGVDGTHPVVHPAAGSHANKFYGRRSTSAARPSRASVATTRAGRTSSSARP